MPYVDVHTDPVPYRVHIEAGVLGDVGALVHSVAPSDRAILIIDRNVKECTRLAGVLESLRSAGYEVVVHELVAIESNKTLNAVSTICDAMLAGRLERGSPLVALGGGLTGDVGGFAAACYLRGVPFIAAPTTLLAMVDASIGGKTGVNHPLPGPLPARVLGKNLLGAFWQPRAVVSDPRTLSTLEPRDLRCGLAECIKHAIIADAGLLDWIVDRMDAVLACNTEAMVELITRCAAIKAEVVGDDEREAGARRAVLNLGHTFAHAIEPLPELDLRHGEAVAIGICAAARMSESRGSLSGADREQIEGALALAGLPTALPKSIDAAPLIAAMGYDKKVAAGRIRLVLPRAIGAVTYDDGATGDELEVAWRAVGRHG